MIAIIFPIIFLVAFFVMFFGVFKKAAENAKKANDEQSRTQTLDGNGRTPAQNEYLAELRRRAAERRVAQNNALNVGGANRNATHGDDCPAEADAHAHEHVGTEEHYAPIVGSLGGESSEGCPDLDGVRLLSHDVAYDGDDGTKHFDRAKLAQAMVLGEVLNNPRFKHPYKR